MNCIFISKKEKYDKVVLFSLLKGYYNLIEWYSYVKCILYNIVKYNKNINLFKKICEYKYILLFIY